MLAKKNGGRTSKSDALSEDPSKILKQDNSIFNRIRAKAKPTKKEKEPTPSNESIPVPEKEETIEEIFEKLRGGSDSGRSYGDLVTKDERLGKIAMVVEGQGPTIREKDLVETSSGIYQLSRIGDLPPLNIISKVLSDLGGEDLAQKIDVLDIHITPYGYAAFSTSMGLISAFFFLLVSVLFSFSIAFSLISCFIVFLVVSVFVLLIPSFKSKSGAQEIDRVLPYALRHISALLTAGLSIFDAFISVSKTDYGRLSKEFERVVWNVKSGESLPEALEEMNARVNSKPLNRVIIHIKRALQMGGDVSTIISQIADDITFEYRMKIADYVEKLNALAIVYLIVGIVGPVIVGIFTLVYSIPVLTGGEGGKSFSTFSTLTLLFVFPMLLFMLTYLTKVLQPKA